MEQPSLSSAKAILLAVQLAEKCDIPRLRTLVARYPEPLHAQVVLRIVLSHLPEELDSSGYVSFIEDLRAGAISEDTDAAIDTSAVAGLSDAQARKQVRKLGLLPLLWRNAPADAPADPFTQFIIHRSLRIDEYTGVLTQLPALIVPFIQFSPYLRTWFISTILPLLRLNYEYYAEESTVFNIPRFEALSDRASVSLLLSATGKREGIDGGTNTTVGRDLRGIVGPWMYGDSRRKRRKLSNDPSLERSFDSLDEAPLAGHKCLAWEEVFNWIVKQAGTSWKTAVEAVEQWDGPRDLDLGGYEDGRMHLDEEEQQRLERRYARAGLASAYLISEESEDTLYGVQRILTRITTLLDKNRLRTLQAAAALLSPVPPLDKNLLVPRNIAFLRNDSLEDFNLLTEPKEDPIVLLHALLVSSFLCTRVGYLLSIRRAGELVLIQDEAEQRMAFSKLISQISNGPKGDDKHWIKMRNELLWLRSWGAEELTEGANARPGRGIFGSLPKKFIESEVLKLLLANTRYTLARSIYEMSADPPLPKSDLHDTIIGASMNAYDNATNGNRTRGGVKKASDILDAFPETLENSEAKDAAEHLIKMTHLFSKYRLVFKQGESFKPVQLRAHADPIAIIGKVLEQNVRSYANLSEMMEIGMHIVGAGLTVPEFKFDETKTLEGQQLRDEQTIAAKRVVAMCIDAALSEDDFETAYSYIATRLKSIAGPAQTRSPDLERSNSGLFAEIPPRIIDDWSWRAALQAGKYRRNSQTTRPTHFGSSSENLDVRHLEQRMDCLAQALRLAPKATLQEILNVYRRCEEELESLIKQEAEQEAEQEAAWDLGADSAPGGSNMPGGFSSTPSSSKNNTSSRMNEEAPVSLFDLSREGIARAQSGFSALSLLRGSGRKVSTAGGPPLEAQNTGSSAASSTAPKVRKRDQLKNAAVGGLATGVGWLIGAQPARSDEDESES